LYAQTIVLSGEPKSTQHIYRNTCRGGYSTTYMMSEGKLSKSSANGKLKANGKGSRLKATLKCQSRYTSAPSAKRTWDNFSKLSLDALTGIAYLDDSQISRLAITRVASVIRTDDWLFKLSSQPFTK
jgi:Holliday junction resolvase RusA-like endonuclease